MWHFFNKKIHASTSFFMKLECVWNSIYTANSSSRNSSFKKWYFATYFANSGMLLIIFTKSGKWPIWPISPNTNSKKKMSIEVANGFTILIGHMDSSFKEKDPSFLNSSCPQRPLLLDFGIFSYFSFLILKSIFFFFFFGVGIVGVDDVNGAVTTFDANHYLGN